MDLVLLADAAAAAYVAGLSAQAASATDVAARSAFERLRAFLTSRVHLGTSQPEVSYISAQLAESLRENPEDAEELASILDSGSTTTIEGAGTVHGNVTLRGKYVAGRDIRFDR